jgi:hypothetical protein
MEEIPKILMKEDINMDAYKAWNTMEAIEAPDSDQMIRFIEKGIPEEECIEIEY